VCVCGGGCGKSGARRRATETFACLGYVEGETSDGQMAVLKLNLLVPDHGHLCFGSLEAIAIAESRFESFDLRGLRLR